MVRRLFSSIEPLESRIAPAAVMALHPIPDIVVGLNKTSSVLDLGNLYDTTNAPGYNTTVEFTTNFDIDPNTPGLQAGQIVLALRDDVAPVTVQNFLNYVTSVSAKGDYNGVFFHRAVNQPGSPATSTQQGVQNLQILQAGGFDVSNPSTHIQVGPTVHNEFSLPNVEGTIAMAKVGGDPNSGSSEFFFNMGDNSDTLGAANNGGFTVFGSVISGMNVLQKIFQQPLIDETAATNNGALGTVPYQGAYDSNPDHNLVTPAPALSAANYITITKAQIIKTGGVDSDAVSPNIRFDLVSNVDHTTQMAGTLVKPTLSGDKLTLVYNTAKSGVSDITIRATNIVTHEVLGDDTFSVTLKPNLIIAGVGDNFQPVIGPGDAGLVQVAVTNNAGAILKGDFTVKYYLSAVTATDTAGTVLDSSDILLATTPVTLNVASGKTSSITTAVTIPTALAAAQTQYHIISTVTPVSAAAVNELYTDDQPAAAGSSAHTITNTFGNLISNNQLLRSHSTLTYTDVDGQIVTATITGPGLGQLTPTYDASNHLSHIDLDLFDTTAATVVTVAPKTGTNQTVLQSVRVDLNALSNVNAIGVLNLARVDLTGSFIAPGGVKSVALGDIERTNAGDEHLFYLGSSPALAKVQPVVKLGDLDNTTISSGLPVKTLAIASWKNDVSEDISTVPGVKTFLVGGGMQANFEISAKYGDATFVNVNPLATGKTSTFKVGGTMLSSTVKIDGNVGTVDLGAIDSSQILVGADSVLSDVSQFNSVRTIASFIVRGMAGKEFSMSDSDIVAANITAISIKGALDTAGGNDQWGFIADKIGSYSRAASGTGVTAWAAKTGRNLATGVFDAKGKYEVDLL